VWEGGWRWRWVGVEKVTIRFTHPTLVNDENIYTNKSDIAALRENVSIKLQHKLSMRSKFYDFSILLSASAEPPE
jgi:hypothetical protein